MGTSEEFGGHRLEALLTFVPNLQLDAAFAADNRLKLVINVQCRLVSWIKSLIYKHSDETRLANFRISEHNNFVKMVKVWLFHLSLFYLAVVNHKSLTYCCHKS